MTTALTQRTSASGTAAGFGLTCRLPISWIPGDAEVDASNSGTGFFQAAGGTLTGIAAPPTAHFLTAGPSYDAASGRWVPVPAAAISPDGLQYAYAEWDPPAAGMAGSVHVANGPVIGASGRVHVVDAKTGELRDVPGTVRRGFEAVLVLEAGTWKTSELHSRNDLCGS